MAAKQSKGSKNQNATVGDNSKQPKHKNPSKKQPGARTTASLPTHKNKSDTSHANKENISEMHKQMAELQGKVPTTYDCLLLIHCSARIAAAEGRVATEEESDGELVHTSKPAKVKAVKVKMRGEISKGSYQHLEFCQEAATRSSPMKTSWISTKKAFTLTTQLYQQSPAESQLISNQP